MLKKFTKTFIIFFASIGLLSSGLITSPIVADAAKQEQQLVFNIFAEVAEILGVDEQTIIGKVESGKTLGLIAEGYNLSEPTLLAQLEDRAEEHISEALTDGSITQTQATNMKRYLPAMLKILVENKYNSTTNLLSAPYGLRTTSNSKNRISLSWGSVTNATSYNIYRATSTSGPYRKIGTSKTTSFTNKSLRKGTTYCYKVKAVNRLGLSAYSEVLNVTVGGSSSSSNSIGIPTGFTAKAASGTQISLQWNLVTNATNYYIYRATSSSGTYSKIASSQVAYYMDKNVSGNTTYYYKVKAVNNSGLSGYSSMATAIASGNSMGAPANLTAKSLSDDEIELDWDSVSGTSYYYVYRSTSSSGTYGVIATVYDTEYTNYGLSGNTTYYYKVAAYDGSDVGNYSSAVHATTNKESNSDLDAPDDLTITDASYDEISLEWDEVDDADYYYVYRSKTKSGSYSKIATVYDNEYTDDDVSKDTTYYYKVKAYDGHETSDYSSIVYDTTDDDDDDVDAPDDLNVSYVDDDRITLEWDKVDDADYYAVYRSKSKSGTYSKLDNTSKTEYTDKGLKDDTTYYYKVKAYDGNDGSKYSEIVYATTDED